MKEILLYLSELLCNEDKVVVGVSGGPDSMALINLLCELKSKKNLEIVVAHVNHKLRHESAEEALFVKSFCRDNNLIYEYMEISEYTSSNIENEAREKRYEFFLKLVSKYQAKYLMTAHHGDDLMETILMRMVRGSSIKGYSGFRREKILENVILVRPFITVTKEDILEYMEQNGFRYYVDQSNFSDKYTRNRYRNHMLPFLKQENPNVHLKFLKFSQELYKASEFILKQVLEIYDLVSDKQGLKIKELLMLDEFILEKIIEYEISLKYKDNLFLINDKHKEAIITLIKSDSSTGVISLPNNFIAVKDYDYFRIVNNNKSEVIDQVIDEEVSLAEGVIKRISESNSKSNYIIRLNSKDVKLPLRVRSRKKGDKMLVKNLGGRKKVKDILIDEKVSTLKRKDFPIVTDSNDVILWLPGVKKSKFDVETNGIYDIILSYEEE